MAAFDIQQFVDRQKLSSTQVTVLVLCTAIMFIDGLDVFLVGKIAPVIARGMGEQPAAMSQVFLWQQIGLAIGAFLAPPLADRFGRRRTLIVSAVLFGALTVATAFAQTLFQFAVLRGIAGIFLSGVLPMAIALIADFAPRKSRGTFVALSLVGYSAGGAAGGAIAAWLIDDYGWQSGFWVGGLVPLALAPLMFLLLPESLQVLANRNPSSPAIPKILRRLDPTVRLTGQEAFVAGDGSRSKEDASLLEVFRDGRAWTTSIVWLACVFSMGNIALLAAWLPTFFQELAGVPVQRFAILAMIAFIGGAIGTLTMGWLMDRIRPALLIPAYYLGNAACLVGLGLIPFGTPVFLGLLIAWNLFQTGGQAGINTMVAQVYPASTRSTALGWAGGAGRIGGIVAPQVGTLALTAQLSLSQTMSLIAIPAVIVAVLLALLNLQIRARVAAAAPAA